MIVTLKCKDGYAGLHCVTDKQFEGLCDLMGRRELAADSRFNSALNRMLNNNALLEIVEEFFIGRERKWLYREGQRRAIPLVPIPSVAEVLDWEQTRARDYFETVDDPILGKLRVPGTPLRLTSHRAEASRPAPRLGEGGIPDTWHARRGGRIRSPRSVPPSMPQSHFQGATGRKHRYASSGSPFEQRRI